MIWSCAELLEKNLGIREPDFCIFSVFQSREDSSSQSCVDSCKLSKNIQPIRGGRKVRLIDLLMPIRSFVCIGRYNRSMSSSDFCIGRLCQSILSSNSFIDRSCFLVLSSYFCIGQLWQSILSSNSFIHRSCFLVLSFDFCIGGLCRSCFLSSDFCILHCVSQF